MEERDKLEELLDEIEADEADIDELLTFRQELYDEIDDVERSIDRNQENQEEWLEAADEYANDPDGCFSPSGDFDSLTKEANELEERLYNLRQVKDELDRMLSQYRLFDKDTCFSNIRYYMRKNDVKIGVIEKKAGVRKGYMSRLDKPGNSTDPSIQFIATAARLLGVSLDELLYGHPEKLSEAEMIVYSFLRDLLEDTKDRKIRWNREKDGVLDQPHASIDQEPQEEHPLLVWDEFQMDFEGVPFRARYGSRFYEDHITDVIGAVYWAYIPGTENTVYIVPCTFTDEIEREEFYEIYIIDDNKKVNGVCNTRQVHPTIVSIVDELNKIAMASSENVYVDEKTKSIIEKYQTKRKQSLKGE